MSSDHLKNEEDVEAILRIAVRGTDSSSGELRARLKMAAEELGISEEELAAAEAKYLREIEGERLAKDAELEDVDLWKKFRRSQVHDFMAHLGTYLAVNMGLFAFDIIGDGRINWAFLPLFGWGIVIVIQLFTTISAYSTENHAEFEKWKRKQIRQRKRTRKSVTNAVSKVENEVMDLVLSGSKIEAIKLVRDETGMGLKEAKEYVEQLERNY